MLILIGNLRILSDPLFPCVLYSNLGITVVVTPCTLAIHGVFQPAP